MYLFIKYNRFYCDFAPRFSFTSGTSYILKKYLFNQKFENVRLNANMLNGLTKSNKRNFFSTAIKFIDTKNILINASYLSIVEDERAHNLNGLHSKKKSQNNQLSKTSKIKVIKIRSCIDDHMLDIRIKKAKQFVQNGHSVCIHIICNVSNSTPLAQPLNGEYTIFADRIVNIFESDTSYITKVNKKDLQKIQIQLIPNLSKKL